jgi:hypothetical protein
MVDLGNYSMYHGEYLLHRVQLVKSVEHRLVIIAAVLGGV